MCGTHARGFACLIHINEDGENGQETHYFHCYQIAKPREMTDKYGNLLWFGNYTAWGRLKKDNRVYNDVALNLDGTIHDKHRGIPPFSKDDRDFLFCQGWKT